jgi:peroxiredoxin
VIESDYLTAWGSKGFAPFIVHTGADVASALRFATEGELSFSLYLDTDETIFNRFSQTDPDTLPFPLAYLIDRKGFVRHVYAGYVEGEITPASLATDVEALLAE